MAASELARPCYSFTEDGILEEVLWTEPGGVMAMEQMPGQEALVSVQKFFCPNESKDARIAFFKKKDGHWKETILCHLPFVHRIAILRVNDRLLLLACTLKSSHEYDEDWSKPGRVYVAELSREEPSTISPKLLIDGLLYNHGLFIQNDGNKDKAYIASDIGVIELSPPDDLNMNWEWKTILDEPTSDICFADLDGDGEKEMVTISPFHGDRIRVFKLENGKYEAAYESERKLPFLHAIYPGKISGKECVFLGNRGEGGELLALLYCKEHMEYKTETIDRFVGPANVYYFQKDGKDRLLAANRETNEVALYYLE